MIQGTRWLSKCASMYQLHVRTLQTVNYVCRVFRDGSLAAWKQNRATLPHLRVQALKPPREVYLKVKVSY